MSKVDINTGTFTVQEDDLVVHTVTFDAFCRIWALFCHIWHFYITTYQEALILMLKKELKKEVLYIFISNYSSKII